MIRSLTVNGYRGFPKFAMKGLGRINLLVGRNNTGKTTLLEALHLLWSANDLGPLWQTLARRGEQPVPEIVSGRPFQFEVEIGHLFTGHQVSFGSEFYIEAANDSPPRSVTFQIAEPKPQENPALFNMLTSQDPSGVGMVLKISSPKMNTQVIPLSRRGALRNDIYNQAAISVRSGKRTIPPIEYIATESLNVPALQQIWNDVALKPEEDLVLRALRFIDPKIERVAPLISPFVGSRGGFVLRREHEDRVPIGSFGDGIWRLFSLAVSLSKAKSGMLLIDEIDTGLHYTVMTDMWRFVDEVSRDFNIQVFATTHSYDCVHSLAAICRDVPDSNSQITIQRIEAGKSEPVRFTEREIQRAADREIETR
jgi:AAA domain, putative AbiEii toxin, Type IV TA system/AAA ATPase domain